MLNTIKLAYKLHKDDLEINRDIYKVNESTKDYLYNFCAPSKIDRLLEVRNNIFKGKLLTFFLTFVVGLFVGILLYNFDIPRDAFFIALLILLTTAAIWMISEDIEVLKSKEEESLLWEIREDIRTSIRKVEELFDINPRSKFNTSLYFSKFSDEDFEVFNRLLKGNHKNKVDMLKTFIDESVVKVKSDQDKIDSQIEDLFEKVNKKDT